MRAHVVMAASLSSCFPLEVGVKQGCVLAPLIFNMHLVTMAPEYHLDLHYFLL